MARDPYQELGVSRTATTDEIRKAFRKLAKQFHPDANPGNKAAEDRFKQVSAAFDILGDVAKKKKFDAGEIDADGREVARGFGGGGFNPGAGSFNRGGFQSRGGAADGPEIDLGDLFGDILGRGPRGGGGFSPRGADVRARLDIDLEEAIRGALSMTLNSTRRTI